MSEADLSEFLCLSAPNQNTCKVGLAMEGLKTQDRVNLIAALAQPKTIIRDGAICKWFEARDLRVSLTAVTVHRDGRCRCAR